MPMPYECHNIQGHWQSHHMVLCNNHKSANLITIAYYLDDWIKLQVLGATVDVTLVVFKLTAHSWFNTETNRPLHILFVLISANKHDESYLGVQIHTNDKENANKKESNA